MEKERGVVEDVEIGRRFAENLLLSVCDVRALLRENWNGLETHD